ncbi:MAG: ATP-binding protein, partial [Chloroflexota bacterium]|nr:ATP-binding protein [Chloroflexota bacterium]
PLESWLRRTFLRELPRQSLVVIAGRNPQARVWRADLDWGDLTRVVSLRNLRPEESQAYLTAQGIPDEQHPAVLSFTHGHPLALSLVADLLSQSGKSAVFSPQNEPDVVRVLLERFVQHVPSPTHRQALDICSHMRITTEALLVDVLGAEDGAAIFAWLRELSFIESSPQGLYPHDLAREVLDADLRWRNPDAYRHLHRQVRNYVVRQLQESSGLKQQQAFFDFLYLHRNNPLMKPYYEWKALGSAYAEAATVQDHPAILEMVRRHEGEVSARIAEYWLRRQPQAFVVFRTSAVPVMGFMATLAIQEATPQDLEADPALQATRAFAQRYGPARPGEEIALQRFWMGRESYQIASEAHNMVAMVSCRQWLTNPKLAWTFLTCADPDYWQPMFAYLNFRRTPEADFAVGERRFGIFAHDWRAEPALLWMEVMGERELAMDLQPEQVSIEGAAPLLVLSQPEFAEAVRQALRDYTRPLALAANPLLQSGLVMERSEKGPTALQALIQEAAESLKANPKDEKFYRAIHRTYLAPAPTQEAAAERLALPFNTYRYQLTRGIQHIIEWLWQREVYGLEA